MPAPRSPFPLPDFVAWLAIQNISAASMRSYVAGVRTLLSYLPGNGPWTPQDVREAALALGQDKPWSWSLACSAWPWFVRQRAAAGVVVPPFPKDTAPEALRALRREARTPTIPPEELLSKNCVLALNLFLTCSRLLLPQIPQLKRGHIITHGSGNVTIDMSDGTMIDVANNQAKAAARVILAWSVGVEPLEITREHLLEKNLLLVPRAPKSTEPSTLPLIKASFAAYSVPLDTRRGTHSNTVSARALQPVLAAATPPAITEDEPSYVYPLGPKPLPGGDPKKLYFPYEDDVIRPDPDQRQDYVDK